MKAICYLCGPRVYRFEGVTFEFSQTIGPWPLKKNRDTKKLAGRGFYKFWDRFNALTKDEQEKYRIGGGCVRIS